jgi:hypothetical protein
VPKILETKMKQYVGKTLEEARKLAAEEKKQIFVAREGFSDHVCPTQDGSWIYVATDGELVVEAW